MPFVLAAGEDIRPCIALQHCIYAWLTLHCCKYMKALNIHFQAGFPIFY